VQGATAKGHKKRITFCAFCIKGMLFIRSFEQHELFFSIACSEFRSFSGAKRAGKRCALAVRTTKGAYPRGRSRGGRRSARCGRHSGRRGCKSAGCPSPGRSV